MIFLYFFYNSLSNVEVYSIIAIVLTHRRTHTLALVSLFFCTFCYLDMVCFSKGLWL